MILATIIIWYMHASIIIVHGKFSGSPIYMHKKILNQHCMHVRDYAHVRFIKFKAQ